MAIPAGGLTVANLDAGTDRPDLARAEILAAVQKINEMLAKLPLYADGEQNGTGTQRVGLLKVGPEAAVPWASATRAVDIGSGSSIFQTSAGSTGIAKNLYTDDDGTTWRYRAVGTAQLIWLSSGGGTSVYNAPSAGGAGTVATITGRLDVSTAGAVTFGANTALHTGTVFHGRVNADGTPIRLPPGWTSSKANTGWYNIVHGKNTFNYTAVASCYNTVKASAVWSNLDSNTLRIETFDHTGVSGDIIFDFVMMMD